MNHARIGGRKEFCRIVNSAMDDAEDLDTNRLTVRVSYLWTQYRVPTTSGIWVFAACMRVGIHPDEVVEAVPELDVALAMIEYVGAAKARKAAA
jgi:hypothetical protein